MGAELEFQSGSPEPFHRDKDEAPRQLGKRPLAFAGITYNPDETFHFSVLNGSLVTYEGSHTEITSIVRHTSEFKVVAAAIHGTNEKSPEVHNKLWLDHDIVPVHITDISDHEAITRHVAEKFDGYVARVNIDPETREVYPRRLVTKEKYRESDPERYQQLEHYADKFQGKRLYHLSSTPQGGGVALMRHAEIDLLNQMGVDAHWGVMLPSPEAFDVTKRSFHNNLQDVPGAEPLTEERKAIYEDWIARNAEIFLPQLANVDVLVIDDPQPSGLIPYIKEMYPDIKILYRSHIQLDTNKIDQPDTPQNEVWEYIYDGKVSEADAFISHPMREFVPANVPMERVVQMGATTDQFDGLNKHLKPDQMEHYLDMVDGFLEEQGGQTPLDRSRPWITQIARFDPSKNIEGVIEEYRIARERMEQEGRTDLPQLVIAGHGAIDDPEGQPLFEKTMSLLQSEKYQHIADDVKVLRIPHIDQPLNALLQGAKVVMQRSTKEGFEIKVTEALLKGKPVIVSDRGGIPKQVEKGEKGYYVVSPENHELAAEHLYNLLTDDELYEGMSQGAKETANPDFLTLQNCVNWLYLANRVVDEGRIKDGHFGSVVDLAQEKYARESAQKMPKKYIIFPAA